MITKIKYPTEIEIYSSINSQYLRINIVCPKCSLRSLYQIHLKQVNEENDTDLLKYKCKNSQCTQKYHILWGKYILTDKENKLIQLKRIIKFQEGNYNV